MHQKKQKNKKKTLIFADFEDCIKVMEGLRSLDPLCGLSEPRFVRAQCVGKQDCLEVKELSEEGPVSIGQLEVLPVAAWLRILTP